MFWATAMTCGRTTPNGHIPVWLFHYTSGFQSLQSQWLVFMVPEEISIKKRISCSKSSLPAKSLVVQVPIGPKVQNMPHCLQLEAFSTVHRCLGFYRLWLSRRVSSIRPTYNNWLSWFQILLLIRVTSAALFHLNIIRHFLNMFCKMKWNARKIFVVKSGCAED